MRIEAMQDLRYSETMQSRASLFTKAAVTAGLLSACGGGSEVTTTGATTATSSSAGGGGATGTADGGGGTTGDGTTTASSGGGGASAACNGKMGATGDSNLKLTFDSVERNANVHVPAKYDPTKLTTLVLNFHGFTMDGDGEASLSKMNAASDERGFVVVYPNGTNTSWNAGDCCGSAASQGVDDVGFVAALIQELEADYCIDTRRVFATGMSNGAFLSHRLGCELSDKIAAIAPVAGVIGIPPADCQPGRAVPVMHFHGTADPLVLYNGGGFTGFISVKDSIARWREIDGCTDVTTVTFEKGDSQCVTSEQCKDGSEVTLCTVTDGGHTWPGGEPLAGGGKTTMDLDATNALLDFFEAHPMP
jgi:polyhydroxybutyrate depolymerase